MQQGCEDRHSSDLLGCPDGSQQPRIRPVVYEEFRSSIVTGFIALARPCSLEGRLIARGTHARYSHAALLGFAGDTLMLGETREHQDARLIAAGLEFYRWPGYYDVYRVKSRCYDPLAAWWFVCHAAGAKYGWRQLWRVGLRRAFGYVVRPIVNSLDPSAPRDCAALVHAAVRYAGGPTVRTYDADAAPGDLCRPDFAEYVATVFSARRQVEEFNRGWAKVQPVTLFTGENP